MRLIAAIMNQRRWQSKLRAPADHGPAARCSPHVVVARPRCIYQPMCQERSSGRSEEEVTFPPERRRRMQFVTASTTKNPTGNFAVGQVVEIIRWKPPPPQSGSRPGVRRHLLTLPRSAVKTYLRQASWLMATSDVPPPSHPIRAVAYSSASVGTLTGGRLTNYSGGTAPDSHRISFSARLPQFYNFSKNRGSRATGRHFMSVSIVNNWSVSGRLTPVNPLYSFSTCETERPHAYPLCHCERSVAIPSAQQRRFADVCSTASRLPRRYAPRNDG